MASLTTLLLTTLATTITASTKNPSLAPTPPMGFNNWARFMCNLNETLFVETADAMAANGLLAAGYNYLNLDDCWMLHERSAKGELQWDPALFPHGLPWLANYVHKKGFKFGIYENAGTMTCGGYPGSQDYEEVDAATFSSWGIDYLKLDACNVELQSGRSKYEEYKYRYTKWASILSKLKKPMIFSESAPAYFSPNFHVEPNNTEWYESFDWVRQSGELARHSDDIKVYGLNITFEPGGHWESMMNNYGMEVRLARYQTCGFFNDPDFLIVDWPDLSMDEKKTHFSLWSAFSAPLILSAYIPDLTREDVAYLTDKDVLAVDQDALCEQATLVSQDGYIDVLTKNLANGDRLVAVLNRGERTNSTRIPLERLGLNPEAEYQAKDLWAKSTKTVKRAVEIKGLRKHATTLLRISGEKKEKLQVTPTGMIFNTLTLDCLAAPESRHSSSAVLTVCNGADEQVWQISARGTVSPLSDDSKCLTADGDKVVLSACEDGKKKTQQWSYGLSGNLVSLEKGLCLTDGKKGKVKLGKCGVELDTQVFALPGGVELTK